MVEAVGIESPSLHIQNTKKTRILSPERFTLTTWLE